jgi:hypothetical protein
MYTYKFRLLFDEVEDFVRDYEILASQTFQDFHNIIIESIKGLNDKELASFYICDGRWDKQIEITLIDMDMVSNTEEDDMPRTIMSEAVLSDFIDDPHQRLIYEYDFLNLKTFYIELLKTFESNSNGKYPQCVHAKEEIPKFMLNLLHERLVPDLENDFFEENDEETKDYYDEEDMQSLSDDLEI